MSSGNQILLLFVGGLAFFLYGMILLQTALKKVGGRRLRALINGLTDQRWTGLFAGGVIATLLQSSSAAVIMFISLSTAGVLTAARAVPLLLGADLGTTLTVQLISIRISNYSLLLFAAGVFLRLFAKRDDTRDWSKILIGAGLVFFGMYLMAEAGTLLARSSRAAALAGFLAQYPFYSLLFGVALTALFQQSAATLGLVMSLGLNGLIDLRGAIPMILGANVGTCLMPLLAAIPARAEGKRIAFLHLLLKVLGAALFYPFLGPLASLAAWSAPGLTHQVANAHTFFNLGLVLLLLPLSRGLARLGERLIAGDPAAEKVFGSRFLDEQSLQTPSLALGNAQREILRMAELIQEMLEAMRHTYGHPETAAAIRQIDDKVDILYEDIKFYLARLSQDGMNEEDAQHYLRLFDAVGHLEEAGDILSKNLVSLLEKKRQEQLYFSEAGLNELRDFHQLILDNFKQVMAAFASNDRSLAAGVVRRKEQVRETEKTLRLAHIARLHQGMKDSQDSSALHLEILGNLKQLNSVITRLVRPLVQVESAE